MGNCTKRQAETVLRKVAAWLGTQGMTSDGSPCPTGQDAYNSGMGPTLVMDWDGPGGHAVVLDGGPDRWAIHAARELADAVKGVFLEPYDGCTLRMYRVA